MSMAITAADVKKLRDATGAGMMDSKKALEEADGDFDKAIEVLRVKGAAKAAKRGAERTASAGLVANAGGALVELNSETDFVAKSEGFIALADEIVAAAEQAKAADAEELKSVHAARAARPWPRPSRPSLRSSARRSSSVGSPTSTATRRRTCTVARATCRRPSACWSPSRATTRRPRAAQRCRSQRCGRSSSPATKFPPTWSRRSASIAEATAREEGKPEQALPKIVEGRLNGFFKDVVLLEQPSVQDSKKSVKAVLDDAGVTVTRFARFEVGQG